MRSRRLALLFARADGPRGLTVMAYTSTHFCKIFYIPLYVLLIRTLNGLPRVGGTCCFDGVDPELVGDIFQPLQGFLIGLVVVVHIFLDGFETASNRRDKYRKFCWFLKVSRSWRCFQTPADLPEEEELARGGEDLWHMEQPLPLNPIIRGGLRRWREDDFSILFSWDELFRPVVSTKV